jgi:hypothetical protein
MLIVVEMVSVEHHMFYAHHLYKKGMLAKNRAKGSSAFG